MNIQISSSLQRFFPQSPVGARKTLSIDAALNERFSFQVNLRQETGSPVSVRVDVPAIQGLGIRVRRVGYVPVRDHAAPRLDDPKEMDGLGHIPGFVPDPLFDETQILLPSHETHSFWISVVPNRNNAPGTVAIPVHIVPENGRTRRVSAKVTFHDVRIEPRRDFPVTHWFYVDALIDWYKTELFDERFWKLLERYFWNMSEHGQDVILVPVFTPPLDGVKRPSQLLKVTRGEGWKYVFDWSDVKRYIDLARKCGLKRFEWSHLFTQWGVEHALRIYEGQGEDETLLWPADTPATSSAYRIFLSQFLPDLHAFLEEERLLESSYFHVSDEPHGDAHLANYVAARDLLKELAPWMKVMDALSDIRYADVTDMPVPSIRTFATFLEADVPSWCYYCCSPREEWLNCLVDTPLAKIAMHGLLFYRWPLKGFLHWGYNYWYRSQTRELIDPFTVLDAHNWPQWTCGDTFKVYPGPDGPIDSIRWEILAEALQDYALLQTLGVERDDDRLKPIRSFRDFPKSEIWRKKMRRELLRQAVGVRR